MRDNVAIWWKAGIVVVVIDSGVVGNELLNGRNVATVCCPAEGSIAVLGRVVDVCSPFDKEINYID